MPISYRNRRGAETRSACVQFPPMKVAAALLILAAPLALAQTSASHPTSAAKDAKPLAFEVSSIHIHQGPIQAFMDFSSSGPRVRLEGYNLRGLVMETYNLRNFQISMPGLDEHQDINYDITAIAPDGTTPTRDDFRRMLQTLLADRFQLKAHFEKQSMPVYALVVANGGPRLKPAIDDQHEIHGIHGRNQFLETDSTTMYDLADYISGSFMPDRPVIDRTGLSGTYKLRIEATPEWHINDPQPGDLSIFTAVQEQLGLKLEPSTALLDVLVIDSAQKPTPN